MASSAPIDGQMIRRLVLALATGGILFTSVSSPADTIIYSQNFNSFPDNTPLTSVPGWHDWSGPQGPIIQDGKAVLAEAVLKEKGAGPGIVQMT